ncbi:BEACH domain-containing protein B-like [Phragmites australis]|uniref:BEACH domain-containing protein B-like n=1 Tax=Phragmites australis TaxID=29695 RepID=UPI002D76B1BD|nr:BEACH domain-containing protein B-like [Phragmites australis]
MNIVRGVADLLRKSPPPAASDPASAPASSSGGGRSFLAADLDDAPTPRVVFSDVMEEGVLNTLWKKYENALDKVEKEKSLQFFVLQFVQTFRDWGPQPTEELVDQEFGSDGTVVGCSCGHPSEVILILIQEISLITSTITESGSSPESPSSHHSEQLKNLGLSTERLQVLECLTILTRSLHNCRVFSYYGGVQRVTSLLKAAVAQLKSLNSLLASDDQSSDEAVENTRMMLNVLVWIITIISNFMKLELIISRIPCFVKTTKYTPSNSHLATVTSSTLESTISDTLRHWQQKAIVLVMEAGGVNWLVELLRVIQRLNVKEHWTDLSLHFITLGTLRSTVSGTRAQNHFRSIGGLEILLDGLGLPSSKFSVSKHSSISTDERGEILMLQIQYLQTLSEAVFGNVNSMQFLCESGRVHKFANCICWPAFMIQEFHRQNDNTGASLALDSISGPIYFLDITEWNDYSVKLSNALCSFILPSKDMKYCSDETASSQISVSVPSAYREQSVRWIIRVLLTVFLCIKACTSETELPNHIKVLAKTLQYYMVRMFRRVLISTPALLTAFRVEGVWDLIFSEIFFYFGSPVEDGHFHIVSEIQNGDVNNNRISTDSESSYLTDVNILQVEAISLLEFAATLNENTYNMPECSALLDALEHCISDPLVVSVVLKSFRVILQLAPEQTLASFKSLDIITRVLKAACRQAQELQNFSNLVCFDVIVSGDGSQFKNIEGRTENALICVELAFSLFKEYVTILKAGRILVLHNADCIECLFDLFQEENLRKNVLEQVLALFRLPSSSPQDHAAKLQLCSKYLENFARANEKEKVESELLIDLLFNMREIIMIDHMYYQNLFRDGGCFLHIVSLLNGTFNEVTDERLVLNVLETLTLLLEGNDASKGAFRLLVGGGYQMLQSLLLDFYKWSPSESLLDALLSMLVDGKFELNEKTTIKNEDAIALFFNILQKSSTSLQHYGLVVLQQLLKQSIANRTSCFRAGLLSYLLDWFSIEEKNDTVIEIAELIQIIGAHSICGKDIRKIFALLRCEKIGAKQKHTSLLLTSLSHMLKEKGPEAFFEFSGNDSGIDIKSPFLWPYNRGLSFSCWLRVENFQDNGMMGLFSFFTEDGKGCSAVLNKSALVYESINQKHQCVLLPLKIPPKEWRFLSVTHTIGRAFSGGSQLRCYIDGELVSSEKCGYAKVNEAMTHCTIGTELMPVGEESISIGFEKTFAFNGQMGPVYVFSDALSSEQIKGIYFLGPSYMYSFHGDDSLYRGILDSRDGISSKIIFGLNAQATDGRSLFSVSSALDSADKSTFEATIMRGTKLCSRHLPQDIIYCVGGVSVFFPLFTQFCDSATDVVQSCHTYVSNDKLAAEVIELVATVLDGNVSNQQQMYLLSGLSILGFLLQSATPQLLNIKTLSSLKYMFNILRNCGMSKVLLKDAISQIYLNPQIWVYASYEVQSDLYMFLVKYFETDGRLLPVLCGLPKIIDIVRQYYWEKVDSRYVVASKPLLHPVTKQVIGERPKTEEICKLRLLLLSLAEMSLKLKISPDDIRALVSLFERSQDIACIEDILNTIIRVLSQSSVLSSFLENVNCLGGCCIFINLLKREYEPVRLLGLQLLGKLLAGIPSEKKGTELFPLPIGQCRPIAENLRKEITVAPQLFLDTVSERLFKFPLSDNLCAALFSVLLGGTSPQQVLQENSQFDPSKDKTCNLSSLGPFPVPQILVCIFRYMHSCQDSSARTRILHDILGLLDLNPSNIEALVEHSWISWLETSTKLDVFKDYKSVSKGELDNVETDELILVRNLYSLVLSYYLRSVRGGWHQLDDTVNFFLLKIDQGQLSSLYLLRDILDDIAGSLLLTSVEENIFLLQPCCDNALYFLKLIQELIVNQIGIKLLFPSPSLPKESSQDKIWKEDIKSTINENLNAETNGQCTSLLWRAFKFYDGDKVSDDWWSFFDKVWNIICNLNGQGPSKFLPKGPNVEVVSLGQRARGLVESLNVPAAERAAVVVSGGIGTALGAKMNRFADKATTSRKEIVPRVFFHLVILYLCKAGLENASKCIMQFMSLLPILLVSEDDESKNKLHFLIWSLLIVRSQYGQLDDGARFHVLSHLILETVISGKSIFVNNILGRDDSVEINNNKETGFILSFIQKDRVLAAAADEVKHMKAVEADRLKQLQELHSKLNEYSTKETQLLQTIEDEIHFTITAALSADDSRKAISQLAFDEDQQIVANKWIHISRALMDERGPWSANPFPNNVVTHWKLDKTEDKWRRRFKLKRNYKFDERLCHPSNSRNESSVLSVDQPSLSTKIPDKLKRFLLKGVRGITEDSGYEPFEDTNDTNESSQNTPSEDQNLNNAADSSEYRIATHNKKEPSSTNGDNDYTKVLCSVCCVLVTPKRKLAGQLDITRTVMHFYFEFLVEGTGGSSVFSKFKDKKDPDCKKELGGVERLDGCRDILIETNGVLMQNQSNKIKRHRRWNITKIKAVHWTRYLLQYTALEIFCDDSSAPIFLNFSSQKDAKNAGSLLVSLRNEALFPKGSTKDKNSIISFIDRRVTLEMAENAREQWKRREISNFEYLMIINTLAGRSYNDLTQYPIFPWVLADYTSEKLDFNKSSTFRDLSKPVGALDEKRFKVFEDRYLNFCDPDIPSFYYGSHYSSMGIVLHYMLRLEPFTALHLSLQGGKFDHADRLFHSIDSAYRNSLSNTSDVKELIPEFFYMPEFLENSNSYHLGVKQDGEALGDVALPPWAKGSPEEFIHINRQALESEYVSSNLHHWIDLMFGYKQRGQPAFEAANIFYYVTYEGAVDLENMDDMLQKSAIEDQIANFGQTPIQIFRMKHPRRGPPIPVAHPLYFAPKSITLTSSVSSTISHMSAVLFVGLLENTIILMNEGLVLSVKLWLTTQLQSGGNFTFSGPQEHFFGVGSDVISPRKIGTFLAENVEFGRQCLATMQNNGDNYLILCGNWENSFQIISLSDGRIVQSIRQHKDVVGCVAVSSDGNVVATGSYDTTVMIWHVFRGRPSDKKLRNANFELSEDHVIMERPVHILCGHDDIITCLFVSTELDIVISGSKDGTCIFHTLREGRYVRSIRNPSDMGLSKLVASQHGRVVLYSVSDLSLHMYSINGKHIASSASSGRLNCMELSRCGEFMVCAGEHGQIVLRSMHSLDIVWRYDGAGKAITSLTVTPEECFLAGTKDGCLLVFSIETPLLRRGSLPRNRIKPSTTG